MRSLLLFARSLLLLTMALGTLFAAPAARAQAGGDQLSGTFVYTGPNVASDTGSFTCFGRPVCSGTYVETARPVGCSNSFTFSGTVVLSGIVLASPGPIAGTLTTSNDFNYTTNPNGTCNYTDNPGFGGSTNFTGTWNGTTGTVTIPFDDEAVTITFAATATRMPPVFPVSVTGSITPTSASAQATFQPRSQDAGAMASTYVFALAPPGVVKNAAVTKDTPVACVLAQMNSNGQLSAVSASSLQAYATGVLNAQGNAVTILNNASTPNVAGATFFVGYGTSASSMVNAGVNVSAVAVPGANACNPQPPQTGWWWNPAEGGRGYSIEARDNKLFFAAFHYDVSGRSTWHVASGATSLDGSLFVGDLLSVSGGQTLGGPYTGFPTVSTTGPITLSFNDASRGTMVWPGGTVAIERQPLVPGGLEAAPQASQPESGWWWNPEEAGRGFFIEWQKGYADIAGYMYDDSGNPVWYIAVYPTPNALAFAGSWWSYGNGQTMGGAYKPATQLSNTVAPVTITFSSSSTAVMTLPNGRTTALQRHRF